MRKKHGKDEGRGKSDKSVLIITVVNFWEQLIDLLFIFIVRSLTVDLVITFPS